MFALLKNELYKAFHLKKTYFMMLIAAAAEISMALQIKLGGAPPGAPVINGQSFPLLWLDNLPYLLVIFVAVFIADIWVDEYRTGTFKLTLLRPVKRSALLNAKVISLLCSSAAVIFFALVSSYAVGTAVFGWGGGIVIGDSEYSTLAGITLTLKAGAVTLFPVLGFGVLVMFLALFTDSMGVTIGGALGFMFVSRVFESSAIWRDYSVIYLMSAFYRNLLFGSAWDIVLKNIAVIVLYSIIFYTGSRILFNQKNLVA